MKHHILTLILTSSVLLNADIFNNPNEPVTSNRYIQNAVERVEAARQNTMSVLHTMVKSVEQARQSGIKPEKSIATQIIETHAIGEIAASTANVETTKARAMSLITQAIDKMDPSSTQVIADAIASVEIAKAKAKANIVKATGRVEMSKTKQTRTFKHPKERLTVAKNVSAIKIAESVANTEVARAVSLVEVARSSIESAADSAQGEIETYTPQELEDIKAKATANISSYLAKIEVTKANMLSKIAAEVAKVEIAKLKTKGHAKKENASSTYPKVLIKGD